MAEEEGQPMPYVSEVVLKKRKIKDELAITRKTQLELGKYGAIKSKKQSDVSDIKRPEQFIKEFRAQELDLIRLKQRAKRPKSMISKPRSKLLFVIRIQGKNDMHPKTRKILYNLRLRRVFSGVFVKATEGVIEMLQKVEPYVTYGYPNLKNVKELIYKKGYARIDKKAVPLTDNNIIEQELGKYGVICLEDIVHEIANVGPHFKEVNHFMGPLMLSKPGGVIQGKKQPYREGGDAGNREDEINDLISKMN
ncbi:PREDICTED: 60S ribosomal protein L7-1 [Theobroma cacao]|uniref:60S ribosomal protein L7-1 n=1 Tax=Theobroma cacao TaxID=3641 RepID=A0AB32UML9_THECC|nr:PREDICTED: 60S ribosomal protein L7-1 [Theobroma cacao]XP_007011053.2 PREDICTED: 60S ribosomal protein L7-1 [Theobroma cacao]